MKKRNLAVILIIPFLISLLSIVAINTTFNLVDNDIVEINFKYDATEFCEIGNQILLEATGVLSDNKMPPSAGNFGFVWTSSDEEIATIVKVGDKYYLQGLKRGKVTIVCQNEKGTAFKSFVVSVHDTDGAIEVLENSYRSLDSVESGKNYYGEYDLSSGQKTRAKFGFTVKASDSALLEKLSVDTKSTNVSVNLGANGVGTVDVLGGGEGFFTVKTGTLSADCEFIVVKDGVNVYTYDDLLNCTNRSQNGEIIVLRNSFERLENVYDTDTMTKKSGSQVLFGNYNQKNETFSFDKEVYRFETKFNTEFIEQWNEYAALNPTKAKQINKTIVAGLRVQKDFYGNGYTIDMHDLCYPSGKATEETAPNGQVVSVAQHKDSDLFRGPKPFYAVGQPNETGIVMAYGQDNVGMYVDGDNITVNDVKVKNCDNFNNVMQNLDHTGTVMEIDGDNVTVKNSVISNGKTVLRSFSSQNFTLKNCLLSTARNFLFSTGSNEYVKRTPSDPTKYEYTLLDGSKKSLTVEEFMSYGAKNMGDEAVSQFVMGRGNAATKTTLLSLQKGLSDTSLLEGEGDGIYRGSTVLDDCKFYRSGIASISMDTMFNGPYLYNRSPSELGVIIDGIGSLAEALFPIKPNYVGGVGYPVKLNITGNTQFFDYKNLDEWDITGLIYLGLINNEELNEITGNLTIDDIFPLKDILTQVASSNKYILTTEEDQKRYINIPIAYYGGGVNLSTVSFDGLTTGGITDEYKVDLIDKYLGNTGVGLHSLNNLVLTVTGFEPFKFHFVNEAEGYIDTTTGDLYAPGFMDLINNAKGENAQ